MVGIFANRDERAFFVALRIGAASMMRPMICCS